MLAGGMHLAANRPHCPHAWLDRLATSSWQLVPASESHLAGDKLVPTFGHAAGQDQHTLRFGSTSADTLLVLWQCSQIS